MTQLPRLVLVGLCGLSLLAACERKPVATAVSAAAPRVLTSTEARTVLAEQRGYDAGDWMTFCTPGRYRISHYLKLASALQSLDKEEREKELAAIGDDPKRSAQLFVLCRMLFEPAPGMPFRHPGIGGALFLDHSADSDRNWDGNGYAYTNWPLEPITLYEGIPILVVLGYHGTGVPQPPLDYLDYCRSACRERAERFAPMKDAEIAAKVERFLTTHPAFEGSREELLQQTKP